MINRILIRVKTVQMLYAYLLTRSEFRIDSAPDSSSRDRRFAYNVYLDILMLIIELSGSRPQARVTAPVIPAKLGANRVGKALADTDALKDATRRNGSSLEQLRNCLPALLETIENSSAYGDYSRKRKTTLETDVTLWTTLISTIIAKSAEVEAAFRTNAEFTQAGFEAGIRQAIETLKDYNDTRSAYANAQSDLQRSLDKAYELYHYLLSLMVELTDAQADHIEKAKSKYLATAEDLNPNTRFIDNALIARLRESEELNDFLSEHPHRWADEPVLIKSLLDTIVKSKVYTDYMAAESVSYEDDCNLWRTIFKTIILPSDELAEELEHLSIFWNDDLEIMSTFVIKTLNHFAKSPDSPVKLLPRYKDEEDARFGAELFRFAVSNREQYRSYIDRFINADQWDPERLAFMDIVIMTCAIAELINYPLIPVPVTMNEYVEIANNYSTGRSGQFINGILFSIVNYLKEEHILNK